MTAIGQLNALGVPNWHKWTPSSEWHNPDGALSIALNNINAAMHEDPNSPAGQAVRAVLTVLEIQARSRLNNLLTDADPAEAERFRAEARGLLDVLQVVFEVCVTTHS